MRALSFALSTALLALPLCASGAAARPVTANQIFAAGHGRQPTFTNRPSPEIYRRHGTARPRRLRRAYRIGD